MIVLLDSGPLGILSSPLATPEAMQCHAWLNGLIANGHRAFTSEICDYEARRELLRLDKTASIARLDAFILLVDFMPINRGTMLRAAALWAEARKRGRPTADAAALDADVILAAQAQLLAEELHEQVVVVTVNARHLGQFVDARRWQEIEG
jgi:predicted nucleic acid-binding protein